LYLWLGLLVSIAGSQMQLAAIHWHIRELSGPELAALALGSIGLARIGPVIVFSLIAGSVADSTNRRRLILVTQMSMALMAGALAWLTFTDSLRLWHIYAITALQAVAISFDLPARQALVPNLLPAKDLPNAFSMNSIAMNTGAILGPTLSGLVIAQLGLGYAYLFNCVSFLAVIFALLIIGDIPQQLSQRKAISWEAISEGISFIWGHQLIKATMLTDFFATFFSSANTLMPIIAKDILNVGAQAYGWLIAAQSVGSVGAAFVISQMRTIRRQGPVFLGAVVIFGLGTIAFGFSNSVSAAFWSLVVVGAADSVSTIIRNTIRQLNTPDHIRGRMTSINQIFFQGGPQLGEVEAGVVAQLFGAPFAIISGGVACVVAVAVIMQKWPMLRTYDGAS
jgi:MFS family permease